MLSTWRAASLAALVVACGAAAEDERDLNRPPCGNGIIDSELGEVCDTDDVDGMRCVNINPERPLGTLRCSGTCGWDDRECVAFGDDDGDGVRNEADRDPSDPFAGEDSDGDGCDDCSSGVRDPANDGFDPDGDGFCNGEDVVGDRGCLTGRNAASDPFRSLACEMFDLINRDREIFQSSESAGAPPLVWNEDIWEVAVAHSRDMCDRGYFAHNTPEGLTPSDRARAVGLTYGLGENIVIDFNPYQAQYAFMNEPTCTGHRANVLNAGYLEAAVGYHICDDGRHFGTQNFRGGGPGNSFCRSQANVCNLPPEPVSAAGEDEQCRRCSRIDFEHPQYVRFCPDGQPG